MKASEVLIQRPKGTKGSRLAYATGFLTNTAPVQRLGVRLELSLENLKGEKVDETSDYVASIPPGEVWKFRGIVHNPLAVAAKVVKITEDR